MRIHHHHHQSFNSIVIPNSLPPPLSNPNTSINTLSFQFSPKFPHSNSKSSPHFLALAGRFPLRSRTHIPFCSENDASQELTTTHFSQKPQGRSNGGSGGLELLGKPAPSFRVEEEEKEEEQQQQGSEPEKPSTEDETLAPFLRLFKPQGSIQQQFEERGFESSEFSEDGVNEDRQRENVSAEYYDPKAGDFAVGVVVSGNENRLDINVGADLLGTMLTKEVLPLYEKDMDYLLCDMSKDAEEFMARGKMGIVKCSSKDGDGDDGTLGSPGRPVVEPGTVIFSEVLGRTLSGRPLLSTRRLFRRLAWHRVRQIKQLSEPFEVRIMEWNTGGLLTRIEGLRAFLPKTDLMGRVNSFSELKENVGRRMHVKITRINEDNNELIVSEREAWENLHLKEGTLLEGTVQKILPYGAQIRIGETNRSGLLHISNITQGHLTSVPDLLMVGEKIKVLVVRSMIPDKIFLSTAHLESEPGLFVSNRERVFAEAEQMAKNYCQKLPAIAPTLKLGPVSADVLPFNDEAAMYANWSWFEFERSGGSGSD